MTATTRATAIGFVAIALWALLALFTTGAAGVPRFQLLALTLGIAGGGSLVVLAVLAPRRLRNLRQPLAPWLLGTLGIFGYHGFYYVALERAPPVDASLIAFLWPLLIVLFSGLLPGETLRVRHVVGALLGLLGAGLLVTRGGASLEFDLRYTDGYLAAAACALTWSSYSVLNRRFGGVPTDAVAGFCAVGALLALACHLAFEHWVMPDGLQWLAIVGLGAGPVGAAFFFWDHGTKHGHIALLGVLAYCAPLLSTILLIAFGLAPLTPAVAAACALIVGGGLVAAGALRRR
ncbi:MAG: DMT family transporter, partial [Halofilum sp. (in: g-proteobacteria)]|nr:DMT family transporter [Halofilum sp. (in: g-proteobacteria)]